jgi:preprotein translocase subunit SecE
LAGPFPARDIPPLEIPGRNPYLTPDPTRERIMAMTNPLQFLQQVRSEVSKVVWPTRREVLLTTVMVFILSALAATFFSLVDLGIRTSLTAIIGS